MKSATFLTLTASALMAWTVTGVEASPIGALTGEIFNDAESNSYTDASSIPVSSTDLIEGLTSISTNYVGDYEATGGTLSVLTDGTTGVGTNDGTGPSNAAFDLGTSNWYAEYELPTLNASLGYTLSSVVVTTGHHDNRLNQDYDILVSTDGTNFISLSDGTSQTLGDSGAGFSYDPSGGNGGAAQSTVSPVDTNLGTGIKYVEFVAQQDGGDVYREVDVVGAAVPEPSAWAMLLGGLSLVTFYRSRIR